MVERVKRRNGIEAGVGDWEWSSITPDRRPGTKGQHRGRDVEQNALHAEVEQDSGEGAVSAANIEDPLGPRLSNPLCHMGMHIVVVPFGIRQEPLGVSVVVGG